MKQIAQNYRNGDLLLVDVPSPACRRAGVLVRTDFSLISTGTELMKISESRMSLVGKARARPDQVKKAMQSVSQQGLAATYRKVTNQLDAYTPLGYSLSGTVVEVGPGAEEFSVGQRVACGGNLYALHAEFNWVPRHLCVPVPEGVASVDAAFATVGAVALHGLRQSEAHLGEIACVIGLGLVGQLLVQILRAAGVHVLGLDPVQQRCRLAEEAGAKACAGTDPDGVATLIEELSRLSAGAGADHVFLTAGGDSNEPVELAADLARDRGRVTDIGKCSLDLPWKAYYEKELIVRFSRSYGPGRYDPTYEEEGVDYPIGYVRWTEHRNLKCFLDMVASGSLDMRPLTSAVEPFDDAVEVYERIRTGVQRGVGILFRYSTAPAAPPPEQTGAPKPRRSRPSGTTMGKARFGVIGAGNYASSMLLPHLRERTDVELVEVATRSGLSGANAARKFGFARVSTDYRRLLQDDDIDAVLIATRHDTHASIASDALRAGKAVFVEKPLALDEQQLDELRRAVDESGNDRLMVGFNRRFAPLLVGLRRQWGNRGAPVQVRYDLNAGRLARDSWYGRPDEGGSRIVAEGCHLVDTASWWIGLDPVTVFAVSTPHDPDDASVILSYPDGSIATISYLTHGDDRFPKEEFKVFGQGRVAVLSNFERSELWSGGKRQVQREWGGPNKGQKHELEALVTAVRTGGPMPISYRSLVATTLATLAARRSIAGGTVEPVIPRISEAVVERAGGTDG